MRRFSFALFLALSLVVSVNAGHADKGRDPPDPPAVPTIMDGDHAKALPEDRVPLPSEDKPEQCLSGDGR